VTAPGLLLRPWSEADAQGLRAAIDEDLDHLKPWLGWTLEEPATLERTRERLRGYEAAFREGSAFRYAILDDARPGPILGGVHLASRAGPGAHDVGYWVRRSAARRGIASAAVSALVIQAFERRGVDRVLARCDTANRKSVALVRALGFRPVGEAVVAYPDGTPRPVHELELTADGLTDHEADLRRRARRVRVAVPVPM
jgi:RimJ/RimL family protein N-acetyltransferase